MQGCNLATVDRNRAAAAPIEEACGPTTHSRATDGPQGTLGKNRERNFFFCAEVAPLRMHSFSRLAKIKWISVSALQLG